MPKTKVGPLVLFVLFAFSCGSSGGDPAASSVLSGEAVGRSQEALTRCTGTTQVTNVAGTAIPCQQLGDFSPSLMNLCTYDNGCMAVDANTCDIDSDSSGPGFAILTTSITTSYPCSLILLNCTSYSGCTAKPTGSPSLPNGFFFSNGTGYYANSAGHYCSFSSWSGWLQGGGPTSGAPTYATIPATMTYDGPCTCGVTCVNRQATCGTIPVCGGTLSCGSCASNQVCTNNTCCSPTTCAAQNTTCGTISDGCGGSLSCGGCAAGQACISGSCVTCPASACTVGVTRCADGVVQTCMAQSGQCPTWTTTQTCGLRQACVVGASGTAACECTSSCGASGCLDQYTLASCTTDSFGCAYQTTRNCYPAICASVYNSCYSYGY